MMKLIRFKITNFRSIIDSNWIDCDDVTSLIGINEAGKSNVILGLWKLNPVRGGEIDLLHDMPAKEYSSWRLNPEDIVFVSAEFELDESLIDRVVSISSCETASAEIVNIKRSYDGNYNVSFPNYKVRKEIDASSLKELLQEASKKLEGLTEKTKAEQGIKNKVGNYIDSVSKYLSSKKVLMQSDFATINQFLPSGITQSASSEIYPHFKYVVDSIRDNLALLNPVDPADIPEVNSLMVKELPSFVYYSNYGNLDAQIYLPHAVKWLKGEEVPGIDYSSKVRTLRVLFDFVKLNPEEILDLGKDPVRVVRDVYGTETIKQPTDEEIEKATKQKEERTILLNSAATELTRKFRDWWKQGNYKFRFQADGEFFKIWVSDDKRPEEIELERRSTGLQWFLSFYLVFLVESQEAHKGAILLLDEAGLSLHPLAQKDLIAFFNNLSKTNQLIYTTHSPFLVDTSNIDRSKVF